MRPLVAKFQNKVGDPLWGFLWTLLILPKAWNLGNIFPPFNHFSKARTCHLGRPEVAKDIRICVKVMPTSRTPVAQTTPPSCPSFPWNQVSDSSGVFYGLLRSRTREFGVSSMVRDPVTPNVRAAHGGPAYPRGPGVPHVRPRPGLCRHAHRTRRPYLCIAVHNFFVILKFILETYSVLGD